MAGQVTRIGVQVLSVVLLARLLTPHDYGLLAMVLAVIGVGEILRDFGLSSAAIQSKQLTRGQRTNLAWINSGIGAGLALITFLGAPLVAAVYDEPDLAPMTRALAVTFLLNGMATQYRADLVRSLRFTRLAAADVSAPAVALGVGIALAAGGAGYWALVGQQVTQAVVLLVVLGVSAGWLPGRPDRHAPMRPFLRFGGNLVATGLVGYVANNVDSLIIGTRFGSGPLGYYNRAYQLLTTTVTQLRAPMTTVALPVLSTLQDDVHRFGDYVRRGQVVLGYTLVAAMSVAVGAAEPVVRLALGAQWLPVVPILQLLAVASGMQTLAYVGYWVYLARGLTGDLLRYSVATAVLKITCIVAGSTWGPVGVAGGIALSASLEWPLSLWWLSRRTPLPTRALGLGAIRVLLVGVLSGVAVGVVTAALDLAPVAEVAAAAGTAVAVYAVATAVPAVRRDVLDVVRVLGSARHRRGR